MVHLRIAAGRRVAPRALALLEATASARNLVHLPGAVSKPSGDLILCDIASDEVSLTVANLRDLGVTSDGSVAILAIESQVTEVDDQPRRSTSEADAVIWEDVAERTAQMTGFSPAFLTFLVLALLIAMAGVLEGTAILIIGAMIVGPDFGPVAGACLAIVQRRRDLAVRALAALVGGFSAALVIAGLVAVVLRAAGVFPTYLPSFSQLSPSVETVLGAPGAYTVFVAFCAGIAGMLSLSTSKSGPLIGVLVSVTTVPAAASAALGFTYARYHEAFSSLALLGANVATLLVSGALTLTAQQMVFRRSRRERLQRLDPARRAAGLPVEGG